jgi:hypothetical protein
MRWIVDVGARCNNRCVHCALGDLRSAGGGLDVEAALAAGRDAGADTVTFAGGEPTVYEGLPQWAAAARDRGYRTIQVQTNARRLAYPAYAAKLAEAGVGELDVALYGATAATHDYHTRVPGSFDQTTSGIRNARAARIRAGVTALVTRSSWRDLPETAALAARLGADRLCLMMTRARGAAEADFDRVVPRLGMAGDAVAEAVRVARRARLLVVVRGLPACVLGPAADALAPGSGGAYGAGCEGCAARSGCPGVDPEYASRVNLAELRPLQAAPSVSREHAAAQAAAAFFTGPVRMEAHHPERVPVRAPAANIAQPGKNELLIPMKRKTGEELKQLFPTLWDGGEPATGKAR